MTPESDFDYNRQISRLLTMIALAVVWPPQQGAEVSGADFRAQAERLDEFLESRLLRGFADLPENDLLSLRHLLGLQVQIVESVHADWDDVRTLSDLYGQSLVFVENTATVDFIRVAQLNRSSVSSISPSCMV